MALNAATVFEVRLTGSDTNGGGFRGGGTDWSQQDSPQYSVTDGVATGNNVITSASGAFGADVIGNVVYLAGGSGSLTAGWYDINARTSTTITLDRTVAAGTGITVKIGGALASPGQAGAIATVAGNTVYIKYNASPYVCTTASTNVAGGCVLGSSTTYWAGYDTTRSLYAGIGQNRPTIQLGSGVSTAVIFTGTNNSYFLQSVILDCNNQTASRAVLQSGENFYVKAINGTWNTTGGVLSDNSAGKSILCEVTGCTTTSNASAMRVNGISLYCWVHDNTVAAGQNAVFTGHGVGCIVNNNLGGNGFNGTGGVLTNCISYGNAQAGFSPFNSGGAYINCIAEGNGTWGFLGNASRFVMFNCASYNNTSGRLNNPSSLGQDIGAITGAGSFFTNAASADFTLNGAAGAALKAAGFPASVAGNNNYLDVGALQHQDSGGGGSTGISRARGASGF